MVYGMSPPPTVPRKPPISGVDLGVSIVGIILTVVFSVFAVFIGVFLLAFLDTCPPATCSIGGVIGTVGGTLLITAVLGVIGITFTIVALLRRARAWPLALGTFALCVLTCVIGVYLFGAAAGTGQGLLFG
ncbi:hypothetical protein [Mycolicibacterium mengxianglii]|uniref:hypothetical protein n=1 Tax=Mycolicibacterium mengxianglii TaxID=2736649 RepID=UPI001E332041|nr:hypothetical protein [Mycolicibacterium mengxianglii]